MTSPRHHRIDYVELAATDLQRLKAFYTDTFGWAFNDYGPDYAGIQGATPDDAEVGGLNPEATPSRGGVFVQLYSDDLDATAEAIRANGGDVVNGPYGFPGGRRLHFVDPSGNELGVWTEQQ